LLVITVWGFCEERIFDNCLAGCYVFHFMTGADSSLRGFRLRASFTTFPGKSEFRKGSLSLWQVENLICPFFLIWHVEKKDDSIYAQKYIFLNFAGIY